MGFTSHCQILTSAKDLDERLFCIKRADFASCSRATRTGFKSIPIDECVHL